MLLASKIYLSLDGYCTVIRIPGLMKEGETCTVHTTKTI